MPFSAVRFCRGFLALVLATVFALPARLFAESHLVSSAELQQELLEEASRAREHNQATMRQLLSSDPKADRNLGFSNLCGHDGCWLA